MKLTFKPMPSGFGPRAIQARVTLPNGFEVSVIRSRTSYGGEKGLFELGCFLHTPRRLRKWDKKYRQYSISEVTERLYRLGQVRRFLNGRLPELCCDEVAGWLTIPEAEKLADQIVRLPRVHALIKRHKAEVKALKREYRRAKRAFILGRGPEPKRRDPVSEARWGREAA